MSAPIRVQLRRTKGWRKPDNTIVVARPSRWGNPFTIAAAKDVLDLDEEQARKQCVEAFRDVMLHGVKSQWWFENGRAQFYRIHFGLDRLRGHDLACWCPLDQPCHADVLLELANNPQPKDPE